MLIVQFVTNLNMFPEHRSFLLKNRVKLVQKLIPDYYIEMLRKERMLSDMTTERLRGEKTRSRMTEALLDQLPRTGPHSFVVFMKAMNKFQPGLQAELRGFTLPEEKDFQDNLRILNEEHCAEKPEFQAIIFIPRETRAEGFEVQTLVEHWTKEEKLSVRCLLLFTECLKDEEVCDQILACTYKGVVLVAVLNWEYLEETESVMKTLYFKLQRSSGPKDNMLLPVYTGKNFKPHFLLKHLKCISWFNAMGDLRYDRANVKKYFKHHFA